jgi:glycosyltransferase involved in cell wall biosynthesis
MAPETDAARLFDLSQHPRNIETISVAVTTHFRAVFLDECLRSVLSQTLRATEIVVSEDGADADTAVVLAKHKAAGAPIRHVRNDPPLGQLMNRRQALQLTTGDFVAMLDDDDAWNDDFLSETVSCLQASECDFCSTDHHLMDADSRILEEESDSSSSRFGRSTMIGGRYEDVLYRELVSKPFPLQFTLFAREILAAVGFFPTYAGIVPDFALFLELGAAGVAGFYLPKRLGRYRVHPGQQTHNRIEHEESLTACLRGFYGRHHATISDRERAAVARLYRASVIELAIAHSHARQRSAAMGSLRAYRALGWGWPQPARLAVLVALIGGARKRREVD